MDSVSRRTRSRWNQLYQNSYLEMKKKRHKDQQTGDYTDVESGENSQKKRKLDAREMHVGTSVAAKKKKKILGGREKLDEVKSQETYAGSTYERLHSTGEKRRVFDVSDDLEQMDSDYAIYLEKMYAGVSADLEQMDDDYAVYLEKMHAGDLGQMDDDVSVKHVGSCGNSRSVAGKKEKLVEDVGTSAAEENVDLEKKRDFDVREMHADVSVDADYAYYLEKMHDDVPVDLEQVDGADASVDLEQVDGDVSVDLEEMNGDGVSVDLEKMNGDDVSIDSEHIDGDYAFYLQKMHADNDVSVDLEQMNGADNDVSVDLEEMNGDGVSVDLEKMNGDDVSVDSEHIDGDYAFYLQKMHADNDVSVDLEQMNGADNDVSVDLEQMNGDAISVDLEKMDGDDVSVKLEPMSGDEDLEVMNGDDATVKVEQMSGDDVSVDLEQMNAADDDVCDDLEKMNGDDVSVKLEEMDGDDVCVDLEDTINSVKPSESSDGSDDSESESSSEEEDDYSDDKTGESSASESSEDSESSDDSSYEVEKDNGKGNGAKLANRVEDWMNESHSEQKDQEHENDGGNNTGDYRSSCCNEKKTGDKVISSDKNVLFPISNRTRSRIKKESNGDKVTSVYKKEFFPISNKTRSCNKKVSNGVEVISIDEKELSSIGNSTIKKEWNEDEVVKVMSGKTNDKFDGKSKKSNHIDQMEKGGWEWSEEKGKLGMNKCRGVGEFDLIKILVDSMNAQKDQQQFNVEKTASTNILPSRFKFEDELVVPPPEKSEWEVLVDSRFHELELGLRQSEMDCNDSCEKENVKFSLYKEVNETPADRCARGEHLSVLDEEIGIICYYCHAVILDIKYVLPAFYERPFSRRAWREPDVSPGSTTSPFQFPGHDCSRAQYTTTRVKGTVWDLIPGIEEGMFPHQREGFEFIWRNIAGDIVINNLNQNACDSRGCIISHAPGTGKTRLTIAFLQTYLKQYPDCCPVILAPKGMLLTWESEFSKWNFNVPFHNLNSKDLTGIENEVAVHILGGVGGPISREATRILKLYSWTKHGGILGVSYTLFVKLAREDANEGLHAMIKKVLLERPGLLVLDEGHTPRNDRSMIYKALMKVSTMKRIILSGTPFQNNMLELFNTLSLVNPKFVKQIGCEDHSVRKRWMALTNSTGKTRDTGLRNLRAMLDAFVHVHKGTILEDKLPGLRHTVVFLHPTDCQKKILEEASSKVKNVFRRIRFVSMVSVHPSLKAAIEKLPIETSKTEEDVNAGVKMKFLLRLVQLADALGERVLIFSQFIDPLTFIMKQIERHLSWREGSEVLYMDGQLDERQRQDSISSFNDSKSKAKVLLASQRACSEGINLVGASRVVLLDTVWNPSMEKQATSRAYRLGQTKIVHVYRLFTSGVEVRQFAHQIKKVQISELIFSHGDGQPCRTKKSSSSSGDKLLEAMLDLKGFNAIFEKIIYQPDESHLIDIFGLEGKN